jgi:hypothetical protein
LGVLLDQHDIDAPLGKSDGGGDPGDAAAGHHNRPPRAGQSWLRLSRIRLSCPRLSCLAVRPPGQSWLPGGTRMRNGPAVAAGAPL